MSYHRQVAVDVLKSFVSSVIVASTNVRRNIITVSSMIHRRLQQQTASLNELYCSQANIHKTESVDLDYC